MRYLTGLFFMAAAVRLIAAGALSEERVVFSDSRDYFLIADNVLAGEGFLDEGGHRASRPPGYPAFLVPFRAVFGESIRPIQAVQAILGAATCILLILLATPLLGVRAARLAGMACALHPLLAATSAAILVETLFGALLVLEIYLLRRAVTERCPKWGALAGLVSGAATLVQVSHALLFLFMLPFVVRAAPPNTAGRRLLPSLAAFVAAALILPAVWMARNAVQLGTVNLTTRTGKGLYESFGLGATGGTATEKIIWPSREGLTEVEWDKQLRRKAWREIKRDPVRAVRLAFEKERRFWNVIPNHEGFRTTLPVLASLAVSVPVLVFFVAGLFRLRRLAWDSVWFLGPVLYFSLLHLVFMGSVRYRMPLEPLIIAIAAWGLVELASAAKRGATPPPPPTSEAQAPAQP